MLLKSLITQIRQVLLPAEKKKLLFLSGLLFLCALLELVGIGAVIPVIAVLVNPELFQQNTMLQKGLFLLGNPSGTQAILIRFCMAGILFYGTKCVFLSFVNTMQIRFAYKTASRIAQRMTELYVRTEYAFHLNRSSGESLELVRQTRSSFVENLNGIMMLVAECLVIGVLFFSLLLIAPGTASIILGVLVLLSVGTLLFFRNTVNRESRKTLLFGTTINNHILRSVRCIREVKLSGRTAPYLESGKTAFQDICRVEGHLFSLSQKPRFLIEGGAVCLGLGAIAFMVSMGIPTSSIALRISFIGLGLARMMPSFSRLNYYYVRIRSNFPIFCGICSDLTNIHPEKICRKPDCKISLKKNICFEHLCFSYGKKEIFHDLNLVIPVGSSLAIVGPTGSGKSTFLDLTAGLLKPCSGRVIVDGTDIEDNLESWREKIGYVPQTIAIDDASVVENVAFGIPKEKIDHARVMECLKIAQASDFVQELEQKENTILGEQGIRLSGGQRQRIGIARALYPDPEVLMFDEATSALDQVTEAEFVSALENLKNRYTLLIAAHRLSTVEHCDQRFNVKQRL